MDGTATYRQRWLRLILLTCLLSLLANSSSAASLRVSPIRLELSSNTPTSLLRLTNDDEVARVVQVELMAWSQEKQRDSFQPSNDIVVNPPIFTVAPGKTQFIRIGLRHPVTSNDELSYRLFMTEVPQGQAAAAQSGQLNVVLRLSVPIFVSPQTVAIPSLRWTAVSEQDNSIKVTATNTGNTHFQIKSLELTDLKRSQVLAKETQGVYILPGQSWQWLLKPRIRQKAEFFHLSVHTDQGDIDEDIKLD